MKSWAHAIRGLSPDFVARVDEVVTRRARARKEFEQATKEEIALVRQAQNLNPRRQDSGKLDPDMVKAMDWDILEGVLKSGPGVRKVKDGPIVPQNVVDHAAGSEAFIKHAAALLSDKPVLATTSKTSVKDMREMLDALCEASAELVAMVGNSQDADKLKQAVDRTTKELENDPLGLKLALKGMPKKFNPDELHYHIGPLAEYLNNNVDASLARRSNLKGKHKDH